MGSYAVAKVFQLYPNKKILSRDGSIVLDKAKVTVCCKNKALSQQN